MIGKTLLHYRILEKLGEGGMGVVWRAEDLNLSREVAVKVLPEKFAADADRRAKFAREARAIAALSHPNIVTIHSVEQSDGLHFFTMELVQGESLSRLIPQHGLALERFLALAIPLADAISAAHARGIIHRDLKPSNIIISPDGKAKILDFGLAKFRQGEMQKVLSDSTLSAEGQFEGTLNYMSPEQVRCDPLDHRTDIFSLGIIFYEMVTGRRPFSGRSPAEVLAAILKDPPFPADKLNPRLPHKLALVLGHCLEKDLDRRMQSALDLRNELEQIRRDLAAGVTETTPSIAVLPFSDMSRERDQEYFCEGIAEEIINALSRLRGLRVASRTSAFQFKGAALDSREIGRRLGVRTLLEGSVRKAGNRLRIAVQLIDAEDGYHLWSERFDREMSDVFDIQDEMARNVVQALQLKLSPKEQLTLQKVPTTDVQAYDYYLRGRKYYYQFSRRDMEFALQLFSRAIELDSNYARAYAGLADCWSYMYLYAEHTEAVHQQADAASRRAVELDPELAQAHASRAIALSLGKQDAEAEQAFERALQLDSNLFEAHYFYARHCFARGQLEKAVKLYEQAMRVRPEDFQAPLLVAQIYDDLGRKADAVAARRRGVAIAEQHLRLNPDDARAVYMAANGLVELSERERGREWAERALSIWPEDPMLLYNVGCIFSLLGLLERAMDCLEKGVRLGLTQKAWFEHDNNLDPLREHSRFKALMQSF